MKKINFKKEDLENYYINQELSTRDIAKIYKVGQTTIRRWLNKCDIKTRDFKEAQSAIAYRDKKKNLAKRYSEEYLQKSKNNGSRLFKVCPQCHKVFETIKSNKNIYCSRECFGKSIQGQYYRNIRPSKSLNYCSKCFKLLDNPWSKYCPECLHEVKTTKTRVHTTCSYCGKDLFLIPSLFKKNERNYCNIACMSKDYINRFSGENSPTWKGGKKHYKGQWLRQRDLARERDNYTCKICNITEQNYGKQMDVHHIINYRKFKDKKEANKLNNLVCLCHECHRFVHSKANKNKIYIIDKI